jgi:hypothetical protein
MNPILGLRLSEFDRPINVGIHSPVDKDIVIKAVWRSDNAKFSLNEVKSWTEKRPA